MPHVAGRVYAMTRAEAAGSGNLVMGCSMIARMNCSVLYDSGRHTLLCQKLV